MWATDTKLAERKVSVPKDNGILAGSQSELPTLQNNTFTCLGMLIPGSA